ncbi:HET-domain-containing protein [Annulohypoxylon truncatum]|uniref:HET-domain-containing protein n=1 Tax=Annulohypoxylon truncatum TaxID=327061 RepID=UPI0020076E05|nr:HET-domain-containing protein [Annulohypoxylon truncatum]KAI1207867.1 HET-domain-containing protein [Annulohypoxylon truncatum]
MWLINTDSLELDYVENPDNVKYAILSHTWEEEEVNFQEMKLHQATARKKKGFDKIAATCRLAEERGIPYAWVDTCCIDKTSSAALSEAINSMFQWYKDSFVCYAYLSDMSVHDFDKQDNRIKAGFAKCRWFARGWTLQELIAPEILNFYDRDWNLVGSKELYRQEISRITGIDVKVLMNSQLLPNIPVGKRMSWASKRKTTRVEDIAYCLLGIFDVNMPMIYGEGRKAFIRLQEEILKNTDDLSLFAWTAQSEDESGNGQPILPDRYWLGIRGVLAQSPSEFSGCGNLEHINDSSVDIGEFSMTNKGLRIQVVPGTAEEGDSFLTMPLSCTMSPADKNKQEIAIQLQKFKLQYVRHRTFRTFTIPANRTTEKRPPLTVYIKKDVAESSARELYKSQIIHLTYKFRLPPKEQARVIAVYPSLAWNPTSNTLSTPPYGSFISCLEFRMVPRGWNFLVCCVRQLNHNPRGPDMLDNISVVIWSDRDPKTERKMKEVLDLLKNQDQDNRYKIVSTNDCWQRLYALQSSG